MKKFLIRIKSNGGDDKISSMIVDIFSSMRDHQIIVRCDSEGGYTDGENVTRIWIDEIKNINQISLIGVGLGFSTPFLKNSIEYALKKEEEREIAKILEISNNLNSSPIYSFNLKDIIIKFPEIEELRYQLHTRQKYDGETYPVSKGNQRRNQQKNK